MPPLRSQTLADLHELRAAPQCLQPLRGHHPFTIHSSPVPAIAAAAP